MPLKLKPPRKGKTPYYSIRGTYLGIHVDQSTGSSRREIAEGILRKKRYDIERGAVARPGELTFADAAINYMTSGGERRFLKHILRVIGSLPLSAIDQAAIDRCAATVLPRSNAATRNRQVYTPISSVLKRAGRDHKIKRPIGWRGERRTFWLSPKQVFAIFRGSSKIAAPPEVRIEFRIFLYLLCYTGMRLGDALKLECHNVDLEKQTALLPKTKNGKPRLAYLPMAVVAELRRLPHGLDRFGRVFSFHAGSRLNNLLDMSLKKAKIKLPDRLAFHVFCHTWATWMRQHGGLDTYDLVKTDRWSDPGSADRYAHVVVSGIAKRADMLPVEDVA